MTTLVRPLTESSLGSCDWGGCDDETVAERFDPKLDAWLAVCRVHGKVKPDRRQSPGRAACPHCGTEYALSVQGLLRAHNHGFARRCPGSGGAPEVKG